MKKIIIIILSIILIISVNGEVVLDNNYHEFLVNFSGFWNSVTIKNSFFVGDKNYFNNSLDFNNETLTHVLIKNCKFIKGKIHLVDNIVLDGFTFDEDINYYIYNTKKKYIYTTK